MNKKLLRACLLLSSLAVCMISCGETTSNDDVVDETDPQYYELIEQRVEFDDTNELNFVEDFEGGMSNDLWYAVDGYWDAGSVTPHNGVRSRNLYYTQDDSDNYLAIRGRGIYNEEDPNTKNLPEGAVIITKDHLTPGRYEIEMAAFPRFGGCSAMWTYCTTTGNEASSQNEIDIEIGGSSQFTNEWCTTWTTHTNTRSQSVDVSDKLFLNDGRIHKYTFDWYTDYLDSGEKRIDWFIDGEFVTSETGSVVPEHAMPLWVGCWFPSWAGDSKFYDDYMLVKSVSFTAFDVTQYYEDCRAYTGFNLIEPNTLNPQTISFDTIENLNKFSNGDFSKTTSCLNRNYYGWEIDSTSKGTVSFETIDNKSSIVLHADDESTERYHGQYVKQLIGGAYEGYQYELSIDAKLMDTNSVGNIEIYYKDAGNSNVSSEVISIDSTSFKTYTKTITMPERAANLEIDITSEDGSVAYQNASLVYVR